MLAYHRSFVGGWLVLFGLFVRFSAFLQRVARARAVGLSFLVSCPMAEGGDEHVVWVGNVAFATPASSLLAALRQAAAPRPVKCRMKHRGTAAQAYLKRDIDHVHMQYSCCSRSPVSIHRHVHLLPPRAADRGPAKSDVMFNRTPWIYPSQTVVNVTPWTLPPTQTPTNV